MVDKNDLLLEQLKMASQLHRHEDNLSWQKFNHFILTNGALVSASLLLITSFSNEPDPVIFFIIPVISFFAAILSILWAYTQKRGQLYQNWRIFQAKIIECKLAEVVFKINKDEIKKGNYFPNLHQFGIGDEELEDYIKKMGGEYEIPEDKLPKTEKVLRIKNSTQDIMSYIAFTFAIIWLFLFLISIPYVLTTILISNLTYNLSNFFHFVFHPFIYHFI